MAASIGQFSKSESAKIRITDSTHVLLMSPTLPTDHPFNVTMLDSRLQKPFREIYWKAKVETDPLASPGSRSLTSSLGSYIYLPEAEAVKLFAELPIHPEIGVNLTRELWSQLPIKLAASPDRIFVKEFTQADLGKTYLDETVENGKFIPFPSDIA